MSGHKALTGGTVSTLGITLGALQAKNLNGLVDVSAGGVRMEPAIGLRIGEAVSVLHPGSGLSLDGCVVGRNGETTRVSFDSPDAAVVVAVWVRMTNEAALPPKKA